jgi:uncharacterized protein
MPSDLEPALEAEIVALLARGWDGVATRHVETHGARVFIGASEAIKIKRPVAFRYMDFSTREKRAAACHRELEINQRFAPELYLGLVAITREPNASLALDGAGKVLEYGVRMRAFAADAGLDQIASHGALPVQLANALGDTVAGMHAAAPAAEPGRGRSIPLIRERLIASARDRADVLGAAAVNALEAATGAHLPAVTAILEARRAAGCVRRVHGDLHLGNIVLWQGRPTPFDAIEFDEDLGTLDPLYDLAFLLMDLVQRGQATAATVVLNRYLWRLGTVALQDGTWEALRVLPLAMSLRALVRAVVAVDRGPIAFDEARNYLAAALSLASPVKPRLIAIGGYSGSGKSTLAAALAPGLGAAPGAIHLRSDVERKGLFGVEPEHTLGPDGYTAEASAQTYARVLEKARRALIAGHSVIVDAVFDRAVDRQAIEAVARACGVPFHGAWLQASREVLAARVAARVGDASDATIAVLDRQLARGSAGRQWHVLHAGGNADTTLAAGRLWLA